MSCVYYITYVVIFPAPKPHHLLESTNLYCLATEVHIKDFNNNNNNNNNMSEWLAQSCYVTENGRESNSRPFDLESSALVIYIYI